MGKYDVLLYCLRGFVLFFIESFYDMPLLSLSFVFSCSKQLLVVQKFREWVIVSDACWCCVAEYCVNVRMSTRVENW